MNFRLILLVFCVAYTFIGCEYIENREYNGKTFKVRTELKEGSKVKVLTWENANKLEYDKENYQYNFYVDGRLVVIDPRGTTIIEEQQSNKPNRFTILETFKVRIKETGNIITITEDEFDPKVFEKLDNK